MTGQGSRQFEAIKRAKDRVFICESKEYRTRDNHRVRALQRKHGNKVKNPAGGGLETVHVHTYFAGEVWMSKDGGPKQWHARYWTHYGEDLTGRTEYDLVEYHEKVAAQPTLFG